MTPELRFLQDIPFARIHAALQAAFADYAVDMSYMTERYLMLRCRKNGVDLACSPGVFAGDDLVGLTLVGLGPWRGGLGAFDSATGLVKAYRGQGLASSMFDFALPALKARGAGTFVLDVLQENKPAIRAYGKAGFTIARELDCHEWWCEGPVEPLPTPAGIRMDREGPEALTEFEQDAEWPLAWESSFDAQRRVGEDLMVMVARDGEQRAGFAAYYPELGWLMAVQVKPRWRRRGIASALLSRIMAEHGRPGARIRADNFQADDLASRALMARLGFGIKVSQYEMTCPL